ncbi:hypothetical protein OPIT5_23470 [Opitutaceae bacterium TAV5]|nr:hypothetical protein OPIT5_23470 [Opitutaceae bacterium TAV5]
MNTTTRALLQTLLTNDPLLTPPERTVLERTLAGQPEAAITARPSGPDGPPLLVTQQQVAKTLNLSRVTIWRMTRDRLLHPVEVLPGTWRYQWNEVARLAEEGQRAVIAPAKRSQSFSIAV